MTAGAGKYDKLATYVREQADADLVCVIVVGGNQGDGFAVQSVSPILLRKLPGFLFDTAAEIGAEIEKDIREAKPS